MQNITIHASADPGHAFKGQVHVAGSLLGTLQVNEILRPGSEAAILIDEDVVGDLVVGGPVHGNLVITGKVASTGSIALSSVLADDASLTVNGGVHGTVEAAAVAGVLHVDSDVDGTFDLGSISGGVSFGNGFDGQLSATTLTGGLLIDGDPNDANQGLNGTVTFSSDVAAGGVIEIDGPAGLTGHLNLRDLLGGIVVTGDVSGRVGVHTLGGETYEDGPYGILQIDGDLVAAGQVAVGAELTGLLSVRQLSGRVCVRGDLSGRVEVLESLIRTEADPAICVDEDLTGQIRIYGPFDADSAEDDVVVIRGAMPFPGAFTVDFDGYDENDDWDSSVYVVVDQSDPNDPNSATARYNDNTPAVRVYRVTSCLGDLDNDGSVGFSDINPFVAAQAGPAQYAALMPGLEGSMVYHCDVNEDGSCNIHDINCFVYLVTYGVCGPCPDEGDREAPPSPGDLAVLLAQHVSPELYDKLVWVVEEAAGQQKTKQLQTYWEAVYQALTE